MSIDWSKVPEGATHYNNESEDFYASWYKVVDGEITHYNEFGDMWIPASDSCVFPKVSDLQAIASRWTGEGLPPVGHAVCEYRGAHQWDVWTVVNIFAEWGEGSRRVVFIDFGDGWREERDPERFRPIRTPEQIAAEEREATLTDIALLMGKDPERPRIRKMAAILYDAGYRKQVQS